MINYNPEEVKSNNEYDPIPEGDYEVVIENASFKVNKNGKKYISLTCGIREDVEQNYKRRKIFESSYPLTATGEWNDKRLFGILGACKRPKTNYADYNELLADLEGRYCQAHVVIKEYQGSKNNSVAYYHSTKFPAQELGKKETEAFNVNVINDDDMPF